MRRMTEELRSTGDVQLSREENKMDARTITLMGLGFIQGLHAPYGVQANLDVANNIDEQGDVNLEGLSPELRVAAYAIGAYLHSVDTDITTVSERNAAMGRARENREAILESIRGKPLFSSSTHIRRSRDGWSADLDKAKFK